ncbi:MAG TPA: Asp23/Gls24 family envelope stress response protein [Micromonosporaceae bacterium]
MTETVAAPAQAELPTEAPAVQAESQSAVDVVKDKAAEVVERAGDALEKAGDALDKAGDAVNAATDRAVAATREAAGNAVTRIRNNATMPAERGRTILANEVVEKIAGIAAREVPGVYDLGGDVARIFAAVKERLHLGEENQGQGVSVVLDGKTAEITVTIVIEFGFQVFSVTDKVRQKVISSVENLLGLEVTNVDVVVDDVHIDDDGPVGNDAERAPTYSGETQAIVVGSAVAANG